MRDWAMRHGLPMALGSNQKRRPWTTTHLLIAYLLTHSGPTKPWRFVRPELPAELVALVRSMATERPGRRRAR